MVIIFKIFIILAHIMHITITNGGGSGGRKQSPPGPRGKTGRETERSGGPRDDTIPKTGRTEGPKKKETEGNMISNSKQAWEVGETVKVGWMTLTVLEKIPTPGDYRPDKYHLVDLRNGNEYEFTPHRGIKKRFDPEGG